MINVLSRLQLRRRRQPIAEVEGGHEANGDWGNGWLKTNSAGSGPFILKQLEAGRDARPSRPTSNYYGRQAEAEAGACGATSPRNRPQRLLLESGDVDIARNLVGRSARRPAPERRIRYHRDRRRAPSLYLGLNTKNQYLGRPARSDEAIRYLMDYDGLAEDGARGKAWVVNQTFLPNGVLGYRRFQSLSSSTSTRRRRSRPRPAIPTASLITVNVAST